MLSRMHPRHRLWGRMAAVALAAGCLGVWAPAPAAAAAGRASEGWYYMNLPARYGSNVTIAGLAAQKGRLEVTVQRLTVVGTEFHTQDLAATWSPGASTLHGWNPNGTSPTPYGGPIHLVFPSQFPRDFAAVPVKVEEGTGQAAHIVVRWPPSIDAYGSDANPASSASPGSLDNRIVAVTGHWLWVAMKGPQYPPLYPGQGPLVWAFRSWNRLMALNLSTGVDRVYSLPPLYALQESEFSPAPQVVQMGSHVYAAVGSWIGVLPRPGVARDIPVPIQQPAPPRAVRRDGTVALADLRYLYAQEVNSLAAYWDSVMGHHVPGLPFYPHGENPSGWNTDPVIVNHGVYPATLIWAMEYPYPPGSREATGRTAMAKAIVRLLTSPLDGDAESVALPSYATVRHAFHDNPPYSLPGYRIRDNVYWPDNSAVLNEGVPTLAADFPRYQSFAGPLTSLLDLRSAVPPELPQLGDRTPFSDILATPAHQHLDLSYTVDAGAVPNGYAVTVSYGPPLPANSPKIQAGNAELMFSTAGILGSRVPRSMTWTAHARFPGATHSTVALGQGVSGTLWRGTEQRSRVEGITWTEDGVRWTIPPAPGFNGNVLTAARKEAATLAGMTFPLARSAHGILSFGSDAPSEVVYHGYGTTYAVYATGWRAPEYAALMLGGR